MKKAKVAKDVTIIGTVTATGRDDDGDVNAIIISTDREDYLVESNRLGRELLEMEGEEVEVRGRLIIDADGNHRISVRSYDFIDDTYDEDDDYDDDDDDDYDEEDY